MNTEQREEIEEAIQTVEESLQYGFPCFTADCMLPLAKFARQQLNLRVDVELLVKKLSDTDIVLTTWSGDAVPDEAIPAIEALVLECLTTTPEEKE